MPKYYIAYGSNLNVNQMFYRCPTARIIGTAMLEGWELLFKGSKTGSYLTIEEKEGSCVPVGIWEIRSGDEAALDRYEGFPTFYYKKELDVTFRGITTGKLRRRKAMVYIMHENRPLGLPSNAYVRTCAEGYRFFGFDTAFLAEAIDKSKEGSDHE